MLDYNKLRKEFTEILNSYTADDLQEWLDMDEKRTAFADERWVKMSVAERKSEILASNCGMLLDIALSDGSLDEEDEPEIIVNNAFARKPRKTPVRRKKEVLV